MEELHKIKDEKIEELAKKAQGEKEIKAMIS